MEENRTNNKILIIIIAILSIVVLGLSGYIICDKMNNTEKSYSNDKEEKDSNSKTTSVSNSKYETITDAEINQYFKDSVLVYELQRRLDTVDDVEKYLNKNNQYFLKELLYRMFIELDNSDKEFGPIEQNTIIEKSKEIYGHDINYDFNDINDNDGDVIFKWDKSKKQYSFELESFWRNDIPPILMFKKIIDTKKNDDNSYDITTRQTWSERQPEEIDDSNFYFSYLDAYNETNPKFFVEISRYGEYDMDEMSEFVLKKMDEVKEGGYYKYHLVKENGTIKVTNYTPILTK